MSKQSNKSKSSKKELHVKQVAGEVPGVCPKCNYSFDLATAVSPTRMDKPPERPGADDATICLNCGAVLCFNEDLSMRIASIMDWQRFRRTITNYDLFMLTIKTVQEIAAERAKGKDK